MEYYSATKKGEVLIHATTGMNPVSFMSSIKKPDTKSFDLYDPLYMKCPE